MNPPQLPQVSHPKATLNRVAKAARLVSWIDNSGMFMCPDVEVIASIGPELWEMIAAQAVEETPSTQTVSMVVGMYAEREIAAINKAAEAER